jgi:hypothetical protein
MAYKSRFTDKPTKRVSAGQLAQKTKDSYSKAFDKKQREVRRDKQKQELNQFKGELMASDRVLKDSSGNFVYNKNTGEPVYLGSKPVFDTDSSSPTFGQYVSTSVADRSQQLANKYGPTFKEILGDIGGGLGSIFQGFAEKGPPIVQILKGLYQKGKDYFTQPSGIEEAVPQATGGIYQGQPIETSPQFPYNFETIMKPRPEPLQPSQMSEEQFMESYPELYSQNPLFKQQEYKPFRVSDMDMSGVMASNIGQNVIGNLQNLQNLAQQYNLDKVQFDPFNPNRIGYKDQFMINETPINYQLYGTPQGGGFQLGISYKDGGSVDKYAGLGYKLK